ncbi:metallophosphoesterase [Neorhizobium sp. IRS_2294]|uniref:metallophosphoesterase n=1 Tax=unclassified Neorhizobium TaxID=2629175 RepID=UPI003D26F7D0
MTEPHLRLDIIPDIHGDIDRLNRTLAQLGYEETSTSLRHPAGRVAAFLGDFIDGGTANAAVIDTVRRMEREGAAIAIMGNHELNALLYHTPGRCSGPVQSGFIRAHTPKNTAQHETFLAEFPLGSRQAQDVLDWFLTLPLYLDLPGLRLVHAYWDDAHISTITDRVEDGRLRRQDLQELAFEDEPTPFADAVLSILKGPEAELPEGVNFLDFKGHRRTSARLRWWEAGNRTWHAAALSIPPDQQLPDLPVPESSAIRFYDRSAKPVFFGHYKMHGSPVLDAPNAACLDYPSTPCAYRWDGEQELRPDHLVLVKGNTQIA